ncbi:MAG: ABC transporter ATP-binding protein [Rhizomicrobium sp.]
MGGGTGGFQHLVTEIFGVLGTTTASGRLAILMGGFAILMVVRGFVIALRDRTVMSLQIGFVENLRCEIAVALAGAGWDQVLRLRHARVLTIMSNDIQRISGTLNFLLQGTIASVILLAQCVISFALSPLLALLSFALLIGGTIAMIPALRHARRMGRFVGVTNLTLIDNANQFLNGLKLAVSQDLQSGFVSEFRATLADLSSVQLEHFRRQSATRSALVTISALVGMIVVLVGFTVLNLSPPVLIAFLLVIGRMSGPAMQIQQGFQQLAHGLPAFESITELLAELKHRPGIQIAARREVPEGPIAFEAVTYRHPQADEIKSHGVRAVSLTIAPGVVFGIAGSSGAGKTTFADLLVGLLRPQAGRVLVGGTALDEATLSAWRFQLSYVSQDPFLFHDTVRRNLLWAKPDASEGDMWEALALADADGIVKRMDGALDAVVGERGTLVSGGERQRIALARALLRKPRLLVLDEATNAIDVDGERTLLQRLLDIRPRPTIVMIAHRAETLALCDRVVRMTDGMLSDDAPGP